MKIPNFLGHHGIERNPFVEEDAQSDLVFKDYCIASTYHPAWDKIYGDPHEPSTSIVFGEKGAGKTAMRLQIARHLQDHNKKSDQRSFIIHYDDFNPYLDRFAERLSRYRRRKPERVLGEWQLWDHLDALLSLAVSGLVDRILNVRHPSESVECELREADVDSLEVHQARDLLLLAACYDHTTSESSHSRWERLRKRLKFWTLKAHWGVLFGAAWTLIGVIIVITLLIQGMQWSYLWIPLVIIAAGWAPWLWRLITRWRIASRVKKAVRVGRCETGALRRILMNFTTAELSGQPIPEHRRNDDRYEMLAKLQSVLKSLGHTGVTALVDRVDEPDLINGHPKLMKLFIWPMLDNKFLKHPGLGVKLMLPIELKPYTDRETSEFYERARLDKQHTIPSLAWTGEALYDLANSRLRACASEGSEPELSDLLSEDISKPRLLEVLRSLRSPRHLFKFMYRLLVAHCNAHTDAEPAWKISSQTFESELALYTRDREAMERGTGSGS